MKKTNASHEFRRMNRKVHPSKFLIEDMAFGCFPDLIKRKWFVV